MGWSLENVVEADGAYLLFEKPDKRLVVTIQKRLAIRSPIVAEGVICGGCKNTSAARHSR